MNISKTKRFFLGSKNSDGLLLSVAMYTALVAIGFVFLYPILYMIAYSFMSVDDLQNYAINRLPSAFYTGNYQTAISVMNYLPVLLQTFYVTATPSILQTIAAAFVGYGLARFDFKGKTLILILVLTTFIIPPQVLLIPRHIMFNNMGLLDSIQVYLLPAISGQGFNSAIFVLIFFQTFRTLPKSLEEAAQLDGAGHFKIFFTIALPLAGPAILVSILFSFVWYWNETYLAAIYLGQSLSTLPLQLERFMNSFNQMFSQQPDINLNEGIEMAGTFMSILPLLVVYFILQRHFVESVDKSGITGE